MSIKTKALFILHFSPPIHGASKVGDTIIQSQEIRNTFNTRFIKIKSSNTIDEIGSLNVKKLWYIFELFIKVVYKLIVFRPRVIYYTASPDGFAFYRDLVIVTPIKIYKSISSFNHKRKLFLHYHAKGINDFSLSSKLSKFLTEYLVRKTQVIFISDIMKNEVENLTTYKRVHIINNGVPLELSNDEFEISLKNKTKLDQINVLYLSNMIKSKGYDKVLEIAKNQKGNIHFHFAGSWASKEDQLFFENFVLENGLGKKVTYHGLVKGETKKDLFKSSHLFVFPTTYKKEIFPLSILEALSYGLPIFTFNTGAIKDVINSKIGVLSNSDKFLEDFKFFKKNYLNDDNYRLCRKHFLDNYTETIFVKTLISTLKA